MPRCAWCMNEFAASALNRDHLFPRSIGGTAEVALMSCRTCQQTISKVEFELSRRSSYGLFLVNAGAAGRDTRKPRSGLIEADYLLVSHPLGGYNEAILRAGKDIPESLPYIEIDLRGGAKQARTRGPNPDAVDKLLACYLKKLSGKPAPNGLLCEIDVRTHDLGAIGADPEFWPRMVLAPGDRLFIRARDPQEAVAFAKAFSAYVAAGAFRDHSQWSHTEIKSGTTHRLALSYNTVAVSRAVLKIACGLVLLALGEENWSEARLPDARAAVLGSNDEFLEKHVVHEREPDGNANCGAMHAAAVLRAEKQLVVCLSLFGSLESVTFPDDDATLQAANGMACISRHDCKGTRLLRGTAAQPILKAFAHFRAAARGREANPSPGEINPEGVTT